MFLNCGIGEDSWESLGLKGDQTSQSYRRSVLTIHWRHCCWNWSSKSLATWCEAPTHWKSPWCWEGVKTGGEGVNRGWDGWMATPILWKWVWASSGSCWWTAKPGVLQSMGSSTVRHDWAIELTEPGIIVTNILDRLFSRLISWKDYCFCSVTCIGQPKISYVSFFVGIFVYGSTFQWFMSILSSLILFKQFRVVWFLVL